MQKGKKWIINLIFGIGVAGITFYAIFRNSDLKEVLGLIKSANGWYWFMGFLLVILFICCESRILYLLLRRQRCRLNPSHCLLYSFFGFFFCCITPSAGGGQPAQVYYMHRDGIGMDISAPVLMVVTITYKFVLVFYGLLIFFLHSRIFPEMPEVVWWWGLTGWICNVIFIAFYCLLLMRPVLIMKPGIGMIRLSGGLLGKEKSIKLEKIFVSFIDRYKDSSQTLQKDVPCLFRITLISILQRTILFSVTWLVLKSFSIHSLSFLGSVMMQAMVSLGTDLLPLPGGTGANEMMFLLLFTGVCGEYMVLPVLLVTRAICYYGQLMISGVVALFAWRFINA